MSKNEDKNGAVITSFKGLDKNFQCRGFAYEVGKSYTHNGEVSACSSGFHSCENPLDVLDYYPLSHGTRFAVVKAGGSISRAGNKIASAKISLEAELKFPEFVVAAVKWVQDSCISESEPTDTDLGDYIQLAASGDRSQLAASGDHSQLAASGDRSQLAASGDHSQLAASGNHSQLAASGYHSKLAASGDHSQLAASGHHSQLAASGENSIAVAAAEKCYAMAGEGGCIALRWTDYRGRPKLAVGYAGENEIKAGVYYKLDSCGNFVECEA